MGYPMTFDRVLNRNGLKDGDYGKTPERWGFVLGVNRRELDDANPMVSEYRRKALDGLESNLQILAGDVRRLVKDTVDERATCLEIARRTGVDVEHVAAVLKEFIAW